MVLGNKTDVYWAEATALDFLLLDWLQWYKDMRNMGRLYIRLCNMQKKYLWFCI
jgi:hypothetical protein